MGCWSQSDYHTRAGQSSELSHVGRFLLPGFPLVRVVLEKAVNRSLPVHSGDEAIPDQNVRHLGLSLPGERSAQLLA